MRLFVGLGNPGAKYAGNRHNIGFMAVDRIAADHGFAPWRAKFQGLISEGTLGGEKVILLKPETFMNRSGQSVQAAIRFYKLAPADIIVFHDELDLAPGKCRHKSGGGHAGHNGLRSIHGHIGDGYDRVRLGIGHPGHKDRVAAYRAARFRQGRCRLARRPAARHQRRRARSGPRRSRPLHERRRPAHRAAALVDLAAQPAKTPARAEEPAPDTRNPLQRLMDRFK